MDAGETDRHGRNRRGKEDSRMFLTAIHPTTHVSEYSEMNFCVVGLRNQLKTNREVQPKLRKGR